VIFALWFLVAPLSRYSPAAVFSAVRLKFVALAIIGLAIPQIVIRMIADPKTSDLRFLAVFDTLIFPDSGSGKFLMPLLASALLWGPAVLVIILRWPAVSIALRRLGPGLIGIVVLTLPLGLATEARYLLGAWPILVLAMVLVLEGSTVANPFKYLFFAFTVINSQLWLKFNIAPWVGNDAVGLEKFPKQMFFLHYGPWMSWPSYLVQFPFVIVGALLLWIVMRPTATSVPKPGG
jgi:hypothetical protein